MPELLMLDARRALAAKYAERYSLDTALVCAVIEQESNWNPYAMRYEPAFYQRYVMPQGLKSSTEAYGRAFSWGLMQIMGEVAREIGFAGHFFSQLCDPDVGVDWGSRKLKLCMDEASGDLTHALLRWNGGGNAEYPNQVLARLATYQVP